MRGGTVDGNNPGTIFSTNRISRKAFAVSSIVDFNLLIFPDTGDFQQLLVIKRMVVDLNFPIEIIGMPTRREQDGLAMSSRNCRFSKEERQKAPALYRSLSTIRDKIRAGEQDFARLEAQAMEQIAGEGMMPEYIRVRSAKDLGAPQITDDLVIVAAARLGQTRLIDNIRI